MFYHRVCLLQLHVYGTRHGRCADRKNQEIMEYIVWLDSGAVMEWERLTAAAQDANRQCAQWFRKASGTHFLRSESPLVRPQAHTRINGDS